MNALSGMTWFVGWEAVAIGSVCVRFDVNTLDHARDDDFTSLSLLPSLVKLIWNESWLDPNWTNILDHLPESLHFLGTSLESFRFLEPFVKVLSRTPMWVGKLNTIVFVLDGDDDYHEP